MMRAVALSDKTVQEKVAKSFVPLKVVIPYGAKEFPLDWEAMSHWRLAYKLMGGEKATGLTGCAVVSSDGKREYANTGSAFVWELFDSTAYDPRKFAAMLDRGAQRAGREQTILKDARLSDTDRERQLASFHKEVRGAVAEEGRGFGRPKGFTDLHALELFYLSGDLFWNPAKE